MKGKIFPLLELSMMNRKVSILYHTIRVVGYNYNQQFGWQRGLYFRPSYIIIFGMEVFYFINRIINLE
ncbi:hypothetical protein BS638_00195 [Clostridium tepidum]|uniref:Uncharacterized protein n=1 Tax=Clostridium tepidum TaxID=1962263 RepID=A0A1S9II16_9CLOT|nr:hypothetical protein BS637_06950 [Clostridium tepidum]OOO69845.1 hypothetical protein BS638_00195 [Clostridium tepidum]